MAKAGAAKFNFGQAGTQASGTAPATRFRFTGRKGRGGRGALLEVGARKRSRKIRGSNAMVRGRSVSRKAGRVSKGGG